MIDSRPSKRRRRNTSGSIRLERGSSGDFFLRSEDMLAPLWSKDVLLGGGLDAQTCAEVRMRLKSEEIVKDILSPDLAAGGWNKDFETESRDMVAMHPSLFLGNHPSSLKADAREASTSPLPLNSWTENDQECSMPLRSLGSKPTSLRSLESVRMSSGDWVADFITNFKDESVDLGSLDPSLLAAAYRGAMTEQPATSPPPLSVPLALHLACLPPSSAPAPLTTSAAKTNAQPSASAMTKKKKKKKSRKRMLNETTVVEPNEGDVLSGRGGFTNIHPGNVRFRQKALELRPWYEESSKAKKQEIASLLVNFVRDNGNRFLGKGKDGQWHEMIGNGPHYKASQALRERIRGGNSN